MGKKLFIKTQGCQMNEYDSDRMQDLLSLSHGFETTTNEEEADLILLNTCSIREKAQEKVFHQLGRWKKLKTKNPNLKIGVGGCVASQEGESIAKRAPQVDLIFGPQTIHRVPTLYENAKKLYEYEENNNWMPETKERTTSNFNNQVRAPYLVSIVLAPNTWNPKNEPVWDVSDSFMAGMFSYGVSIVANDYGIDCAFCSCFEKGLKNYINYITTLHDHSRVYPELARRRDRAKNSGRMQGKSDCLTLIGLGYYDFFGKKKIYNDGNIYDTEKRMKIEIKNTKPKLENIVEWK